MLVDEIARHRLRASRRVDVAFRRMHHRALREDLKRVREIVNIVQPGEDREKPVVLSRGAPADLPFDPVNSYALSRMRSRAEDRPRARP